MGRSVTPGVRSRGVEVEAFFRPIPDLNGSLGATLANTRYQRDLVGTNGNALVPALFQLPGRRISNAPLLTLTGSLGYTPGIGTPRATTQVPTSTSRSCRKRTRS